MFENFGFLFLHKIAANLNLEKAKNLYRNMHFKLADFVSFAITILKNVRIQKTINATVVFSMVSLDITGFEGQKFLNICWRYQRVSPHQKSC